MSVIRSNGKIIYKKTMPGITSPVKAPLEPIAGTVERVTYHNAENGFCVLRVTVKGHKDVVTVVGNISVIMAGEYIQGSGTWVHDRTHGTQFKTHMLQSIPPTSLEGLEKYLGSGMIKGLGPVYAKKLVACFGEQVFDVIENEPHRLQDITGIAQGRASKIIQGWSAQRVIRDIMLFLHSHNISTARAVRIYKTYGAESIHVITQDPYRLARDIRGIGFISADTIAQNVGIEKTSLLRARAGITYALTTSMDDGHCGLPYDRLLPLCQELLDIPMNLVQKALDYEVALGTVIQETIEGKLCVFLSGLFHAERSIAQRLVTLRESPLPWPSFSGEDALTWVEEKTHMALSHTQREAITLALQSKVLIITGGPGVGKTTLVKTLLTILQTKGLHIALAAPTGRAAKRLFECTGMEAKTLHRLLETNPSTGGFSKNEDSPLPCDLLIIDETSMVDVPLMHAVLKALPVSAALVLVGDIDQLPSVGPGNVLSDLIHSNALPVIRLTDVFRQAATSQIITAAHAINKGNMPTLQIHGHERHTQRAANIPTTSLPPPPSSSHTTPAHITPLHTPSSPLPLPLLPPSDFFFIEASDPEKALSLILKVLKERIPLKFGFSPNDIQVLCPISRGIVGTKNLNVELQKALNPPHDNSLSRFGWTYSVGDKVMQITNNYNKLVYNGDIGMIHAISHEEAELTIVFDDRHVVYEFNECDELVLAYAITIHKSQGSEYPVVIIPLMMQHYTMLRRNLIYTGITRGKKLVILIGEKKALAIAVKHKSEHKRWSSLKLRLTTI